MKKAVLIVDDNSNTRNGLIRHINWKEFGFTSVLEAANADQAVEEFKLKTVNLLITDIRMPGMSGLELVDYVALKYPSTVIAVISAYNDFEYAKSAMKNGVKYYIHKPLSIHEVKKVIADINNTLHSRKELEMEIKDIGQKYSKAINFMKSKFMQDVALREITDRQEISKGILEYGFKVSSSGIFVVSVRIISENECIKIKNSKRKFMEALKALFSDRSIILNFFIDGSGDIIIFINKESDILTRDLVKKIESELSQYFGEKYMVGVSKYGSSFFDLALCYEQSREALKYIARDGSRTIFWCDAENIECEKPDYENNISKKIQDVADSLRKGDFKDGTGLIRGIFINMPAAFIKREVYNRFFLKLFFVMDNLLKIDKKYKSSVFNVYKNFISEAEYAKWLCGAINESSGNEPACENSILKILKRYIEKNYREEITLYKMSKELNISQSYICRLFKENMQCSYLEYLTSVRIKKAKGFLSDGTRAVKIYEAGKMAGYANSKHFSQAFKKQTGLTPRDYRQKYMNGN